ncbi:MAG: hypothetical protein A3C30_03030 [Candidatus Levybacteria bacterium RIFCSPHIGHO2_02_FULL_40_18]|nr:MAG: hypothetical protein A2869_04950 [Candidatus Levybacteria bacterium RIFCSPHIGHO2_01_FULL_40_58]OGH26949.1 MAG: hypothetical protein A3C30_03030 [Candidatus Levybacteria bacterium RIFCSPHIGHO2_02_FULL_40_18]OGH32071.1 MAG: hypothetical protein A3E43_04010 [Candidatus Levybacteria bacterium RIFCSPHIGHO2_12_FULL_40_31]OGH40807.1 MAG: hypothetical protein A2894_04390 [Candidatus Levybacteria bacterium RIFCSPLOWO2_01_FULL_40_64]OGH48663.1 MAG: hypothetical protein A3I54_03320 [Candidatus Lev
MFNKYKFLVVVAAIAIAAFGTSILPGNPVETASAEGSGIGVWEQCQADGLVDVSFSWVRNPAATKQWFEVSSGGAYKRYDVGVTDNSIFIGDFKPGVKYTFRLVNQFKNGVGMTGLFQITPGACSAYPPVGTTTCSVPQTIPSLTKDDLKVITSVQAPEGVYEGEWKSTGVIPGGPAKDQGIGKSVVVINDIASSKVTYFFNGNKIAITNWKLLIVPGGLLSFSGGFPLVVFTQQADGSLDGQITFQGQVTSKGNFKLCIPAA